MRGVYTRFLFFTLFFLYFIVGVSAYVSVTPSKYFFDFQPNYKNVFYFDFLSDKNSAFEISVSGDLAEYVKLSTTRLDQPGRVYALVQLPQHIEVPGTHTLEVSGKQIIDSGNGFSIAGDMVGVIKIFVPYPGKYAEIDFDVNDVNVGQDLDILFRVYSRGNESITVTPLVTLYDDQDNVVATIPFDQAFIEAGKVREITRKYSTTSLKAGTYKAVATVSYNGKTATAEKRLRIGHLFVDIIEYTKEFEKGTINPVTLTVESQWNDPIPEVYAVGEIIGYDIRFVTPSVPLERWGQAALVGHFDTTLIEKSPFRAKFTLYYGNKTTEKIVTLRFKREINYVLIGLIAGVVVIGLFFAWVFFKVKRIERETYETVRKKRR